MDIPVLILCGGEGKRLRPHTDNIPKPMLQVKGKPILQWHVERFAKAGFEKFWMCAGYRHEAIQQHFGDGSKFGVKIFYNIENEPLGTAGPIRMLESELRGRTFITLNGDNITNIDPGALMEFHDRMAREKGALATVTLVQLKSPYGIVDVEGDLAKRFVEKPLLPHWLNAGVNVFEPHTLELLPRKGSVEQTVFPLLAERGKLAAYKHTGYWRGIDTVKDLEEVQKDEW